MLAVFDLWSRAGLCSTSCGNFLSPLWEGWGHLTFRWNRQSWRTSRILASWLPEMPALEINFFEWNIIWILQVIITTVELIHLTWFPLFWGLPGHIGTLGLYEGEILRSWKWRLMEKGVKEHFTYFLAMSRDGLSWNSYWFPGQLSIPDRGLPGPSSQL